MNNCRLLVVEDEPGNRDFLLRLMTQAGFTQVVGARDGASALAAFAEAECAVVIVDLQLPDISGLDLVRALHDQKPDAVLVVASMWDEPRMIAQAFEAGCSVFMVKPYGFMELYKRLKDWPAREQLENLLIDQYGPRPYRREAQSAVD